MIRRTTIAAALLTCSMSYAVPAAAAPIVYSFTASMKVTKWNLAAGRPPLSESEEEFWFPNVENGGTYTATGTFAYDPSLVDGSQYGGGEVANLSLAGYTWSLAANLGFVSGPFGISFSDSFPTVVAGLPCLTTPATGVFCDLAGGSLFVGEDAGARLQFAGSPSFGDISIFGRGLHRLSDGRFVNTGISWQGSIDSLTRVPEPGTLVLLSLGGAWALRRRAKRNNGSPAEL